MSNIVVQPNGKFAVWSNVTDIFLVVNMDKNELICFSIERAIKEALCQIDAEIARPIQQWDEVIGTLSKKGQKVINELVKKGELAYP